MESKQLKYETRFKLALNYAKALECKERIRQLEQQIADFQLIGQNHAAVVQQLTQEVEAGNPGYKVDEFFDLQKVEELNG